MYQVFCLKGTPPETLEEQEKCFRSKTRCWRLSTRKHTPPAPGEAARGTEDEPIKVGRSSKSRAS
ncbi:hypothetical protein KSX_37780 [Ktedonospora formicarum]|uniref:Uncharacterized protein n=2 Tax=Ktedonospora formicarum TaxID=2778364 RepID=A0A8J3I2J1_9CHLR|nr:hypothetical protein KSX_37780 [Ktedonospora formicarum]